MADYYQSKCEHKSTHTEKVEDTFSYTTTHDYKPQSYKAYFIIIYYIYYV